MTRKQWSAGDLVGCGGWRALHSYHSSAWFFLVTAAVWRKPTCRPFSVSENPVLSWNLFTTASLREEVQSDLFFSSWHILPKGTCLPSEYVNPVLLTQPSTPSLLSWSWTPRLLLSSDLRKWMCAPKYEYGSVYTQSSGLRENAVTQGHIVHRTFPA